MFTIPKEVYVEKATEITIDQKQEGNDKKDFSACAHKRDALVGLYKCTPS